MKKIVLIGGGGHCKSVIDTLLRLETYDEIIITDPKICKGTEILGCKISGDDDNLYQLIKEYKYALVTVGITKPNPLREKLVDMASSTGFEFPVIIDPSAIIADSAIIYEGTFIGKNCIVNAETVIGKHCIINSGAVLEHECIVSDYSHISVRATLCGKASVGRNSFVGAGSTVLQCVSIGDNTIVGAGALVRKNLPNDCVAFGVPAKIIKDYGENYE